MVLVVKSRPNLNCLSAVLNKGDQPGLSGQGVSFIVFSACWLALCIVSEVSTAIPATTNTLQWVRKANGPTFIGTFCSLVRPGVRGVGPHLADIASPDPLSGGEHHPRFMVSTPCVAHDGKSNSIALTC